MKPPSVETKNEALKKQTEAKEARRQENAKKAKKAADRLFPGEKWEPIEREERIYKFLRSRGQPPNVFINLETSNLTSREIISTLYGARNKPETEKSHGYAYYNKFKGGRIILKIKGQKHLIYLNVDDLKVLGQ